jgi:hypothetical protein
MEWKLVKHARCPYCQASNVRLSRRRGIDKVVVWGSPCRCRSCRERFFRYPPGRFLPFALILAGAAVWAALLLTRSLS